MITVTNPPNASFTVQDETKVYGTDGTSGGTQLLVDLGADGVKLLASIGGEAIFSTQAPLLTIDNPDNAPVIISSGYSPQTYITDGTAAGTHPFTAKASFIDGQFLNRAQTLDVGGSAGQTFLTPGGIIDGGNVHDDRGGALFAGAGLLFAGGELQNVTYQGPLDLSEDFASLTVNGTLTVTDSGGSGPGVINLTGYSSSLTFLNSVTLDNVTLNIGNAHGTDIGSGLNPTNQDVVVTLGPHATLNVVGQIAYFYPAFVNDGVINATHSGIAFMSLHGFTNNGEINISNGEDFAVSGNVGLGNPPPGACINNGTIEITGGGGLQVDDGSISGSGSLTLSAGGSLAMWYGSSDAQTLTMSGDARLAMDLTSTMSGEVVGFDQTDTIEFYQPFSGPEFSVLNLSLENGVLTVESSDGVARTIDFGQLPAGFAFDVRPISGAVDLNLEPVVPASDFSGAGHADLLIENTAGVVDLGQLGAGDQTGFLQMAGLGKEWSFEGVGDFLDNGRGQFLIENASGAVVIGAFGGATTAFDMVGGLGAEWRFEGVGRFLGEATSDFLIENASGAVDVGQVVGGQVVYNQVAALGPEWSFVGAGDFLGHGKADFLIENLAGAVVVGEIGAGDTASFGQVAALGPEWRFVGAGDFLGDGRDQFLIENASGVVVLGEVGGGGQALYSQLTGLGPEWKFVGAGDFLGEGHAQFLIENTAGAVDLGDITGGQLHFTQITALGSEWSFHL